MHGARQGESDEREQRPERPAAGESPVGCQETTPRAVGAESDAGEEVRGVVKNAADLQPEWFCAHATPGTESRRDRQVDECRQRDQGATVPDSGSSTGAPRDVPGQGQHPGRS